MVNRVLAALRGYANLRLVPQDVRRLAEQAGELRRQSAQQTRLLANAERDRLLRSPPLTDPKRLEPFGYKGYSQNDEDGIIQEIFRRIGSTDRRFVEFGTGNGLENNTVFLLVQGWSGLWLDGSAADHRAQHQNFGWAIAEKRLTSAHTFLTVDNINSVIGDAGFRGELDLLSIDIDGNDYHLWKAIDVIQPRVVAIEYNAYAPPPVQWIMAYQQDYAWDGQSSYFSASLQSYERLAHDKVYTLVGCNLSGLNAFFVRNDLVADHFCADNSAVALYQPRRWWLDACYRTEMISYDRPFAQ